MSIINSDSVRMGASGASTGYTIDQSIRFDKTASSRLQLTQGTPDGTSWTLSWWMKRGKIDASEMWFINGGNAYPDYIRFETSEKIRFRIFSRGIDNTTTAVVRDPSAWYHFVANWNGSTGAYNLWQNNVSLISGTGSSGETYYNKSGEFFSLGSQGGGGNYYDGYLSEIVKLDNTVADPTSFGEYNDDGVWVPIDVSGLSFGSEGFYIEGQDSSNLGDDSSGNGNDFTSSGLTSDDQRGDTPTENYGVLSDIFKNTSNLTVSDAGTAVSVNSSALNGRAGVSFGMDTGKWYWELLPDGTFGGQAYHTAGVIQNGRLHSAAPATAHGSGDYEWLFLDNGNKKQNNSTSATGLSTWVASDVVQFAYDADSGELWFGLNDTWEGDPSAGTGASYTGITGTVLPILAPYGGGSGQGAFDTAFEDADLTYTPPTGFSTLSTSSIPAPAIADGSTNFNVVLYTGTGNVTRSVTGAGFQPDLVYNKQRNNTSANVIANAVSGANTFMATDQITAESSFTNSIYGYLSSFDSDGYTLTPGSTNNNYWNESGKNFVSYNWLAGNGTETNEDGSITSTVSANVDAGFSVVEYNASGVTGATLGHGLSQAPDFIVAKDRDSGAHQWIVYHSAEGATRYALLNTSGAFNTNSGPWNNTEPTSSLITLGSSAGWANNTGNDHIIYCWHSVEGFSRLGVYTGNGSTDGVYINTGFAPAFVMIKRADAGVEDWQVMDRPRSPTNVMDDVIYANSSSAEQVANTAFSTDFLSNGFKLRTAHAGRNTSAGTYVYLAFAENPFGGAGVAPATAR